jgi:hypothetical protein
VEPHNPVDVKHPNFVQGATNNAVSPVKWENFCFINNKTNEARFLDNTRQACTIGANVAKWKNRVPFIERIISDAIAHCPKDEELFLISLGSNCLLPEYIIGKTLIENGYSKIAFLMVDTNYLAAQVGTRPHLDDFRREISLVYHSEYEEPFVQDKIKYLSKAQNIQKYFTASANVIVIESLPPYTESIKEMKLYPTELKKEEDLLCGGGIVPIDHANAVSFVPNPILNLWKSRSLDFSVNLPLMLCKIDTSSPFINSFPSPKFILDWGCKIYKDSTSSVSFTGAKRYFASVVEYGSYHSLENVNILGERTITLMKKIKEKINLRVKEIKLDNPNKELSQEDITNLLKEISNIAKESLPVQLECFYTRDFVVDRKEALEWLSVKASHHYRKRFQFLSHPETEYEIVEITI